MGLINRIDLDGNNAETGMFFAGGENVTATSRHWGEVTDLVNLANGDVWRAPNIGEARAVDCFMSDNAYYVTMVTGYEGIKRTLVKYDGVSENIVWKCGLSSFQTMVGGQVRRDFQVFQDEKFIYHSDYKTVFVISKDKGKVVAKHTLPVSGLYTDNKGNSFLISWRFDKQGKNYSYTYNMVNPVDGSVIWEITGLPFNLSFIKIVGAHLYIYFARSTPEPHKLYIINITDGKIIKEHSIEYNGAARTSGQLNAFAHSVYSSGLFIENGKVMAVLRGVDSRVFVSVDIESGESTVADITISLHNEYRLKTAAFGEVVKDGAIILGNESGIFKLDAVSMRTVEMFSSDEPLLDFTVTDNYICCLESDGDISSLLIIK